jgi:hypothetical protein
LLRLSLERSIYDFFFDTPQPKYTIYLKEDTSVLLVIIAEILPTWRLKIGMLHCFSMALHRSRGVTISGNTGLCEKVDRWVSLNGAECSTFSPVSIGLFQNIDSVQIPLYPLPFFFDG